MLINMSDLCVHKKLINSTTDVSQDRLILLKILADWHFDKHF